MKTAPKVTVVQRGAILTSYRKYRQQQNDAFDLTIETFLNTREGEQVIAEYKKNNGHYQRAMDIVDTVFGGALSETDVFMYWFITRGKQEKRNGEDRAKRSKT